MNGSQQYLLLQYSLSVRLQLKPVDLTPLHSALDFDRDKTLGWDYPLFVDPSDPNYSTVINSNFSLTPFDVYYAGVNTDYNNPYTNIDYHNGSLEKNMSHVSYSLHNVNNGSARSVNLEIGDSHMYLDNFTIVSNSLFWPSNEVYAGVRNPLYSYHDSPSDLHMYSRSNPLNWNNKSVILKSDISVLNTSNIINIEDRTLIQESGYEPCQIVYRPAFSKTTDELNKLIGLNISLYPNPNDGNFYIDIKDDSLIKNIEIFNSIGMKVFNAEIPTNLSKIEINLNFAFEPGLYYIRLNYMDGYKSLPIILNR